MSAGANPLTLTGDRHRPAGDIRLIVQAQFDEIGHHTINGQGTLNVLHTIGIAHVNGVRAGAVDGRIRVGDAHESNEFGNRRAQDVEHIGHRAAVDVQVGQGVQAVVDFRRCQADDDAVGHRDRPAGGIRLIVQVQVDEVGHRAIDGQGALDVLHPVGIATLTVSEPEVLMVVFVWTMPTNRTNLVIGVLRTLKVFVPKPPLTFRLVTARRP